MTNKSVDQIRRRDAGGLPKLWIHANRGKARQRVNFIDEDFAVLEEKVDTGQTFASKNLKHSNSKLSNAIRLGGCNICRND